MDSKMPPLYASDHPDFVGGWLWTKIEMQAIRAYGTECRRRALAEVLVREIEELRAALAARPASAGEIAYQLTKRLVIDIATARSAVDAALAARGADHG